MNNKRLLSLAALFCCMHRKPPPKLTPALAGEHFG